MKALLYKEFKLAMHPICYIFICMFPLMILIPSYPIAIGFFYILSCYPILFLGANKGQQSNDLLFSTLLPVRKKDIVLARIITCAIMQFAFMAIMAALLPIATQIHASIPGEEIPGLGIALLGYSIADIIFFAIYYKHGKSIVMSTLLTIIGFIVYLGLLTIGMPFIPGLEWYKDTLSGPLWIQFIILGGALLLYVVLHFVTYRVSSKELEKVDF